jgi:hypothetical protein
MVLSWLETREIPMEAKGNPIKIKLCKNTIATSYKPKVIIQQPYQSIIKIIIKKKK